MKKLLLALALSALTAPAFALQYCALDVQKTDGSWQEVVHADRGEDFGDKTVNKLDDGDTCRSEGRKIGPNQCQDVSGVQYRIRAMKNNGVQKTWFEQC